MKNLLPSYPSLRLFAKFKFLEYAKEASVSLLKSKGKQSLQGYFWMQTSSLICTKSDGNFREAAFGSRQWFLWPLLWWGVGMSGNLLIKTLFLSKYCQDLFGYPVSRVSQSTISSIYWANIKTLYRCTKMTGHCPCNRRVSMWTNNLAFRVPFWAFLNFLLYIKWIKTEPGARMKETSVFCCKRKVP